MRALGVFVAALGLCALTACESEAPIRPVSVDVNLSPCLGAIDSAGVGDRDGSLQPVVSTCRDNLDVQVADATVNACFVVRQIAGGAAQRLPLQWSGGRLTEPFPDRNIELPPGERLEASLFFLATGDENGRVCDDFEVETTCAGGADCVLKLHQVEVTPLADGSTTFDFTEGGLCNAETGDAFGSSAVEVCDGMDNDCDRVVDEEIPGAGESCSDGIGACRSMGMTFCDPAAGMVVCGAMAGAPGDEADPGVDCRDDPATCCDEVDDDCDGVVDEDIACSPCEADEDCAENIAGQQCVATDDGRFCRVCDPADVEHAGCAEDELCCESGGTPRCEPTSFGPDRSEQCEACGSPCVFVDEEQGNRRIANADNCGARQCQCGFGPACGGASPFCVNGQCQECVENGDCAENELCCDGQCQPTGPDTQCEACGETCVAQIANRCVNRVCRCGEAERCVIDQATCTAGPDCGDDPDDPACSPRSFRCEDCAVDLDCQPDANPVAEPACVDRQCRECKDDDDRFCAGPSADDGRPECVISDCFECDRRNHDGCAEDGAEPFCDVDQNACRPCREDAECQSRPGDLNQCEDGRCVVCDPATYEGCPDPDASICDPVSLTCRGCNTTDECNANNEPDDLPTECVEGQCRGCNPDNNQGCRSTGPTPICNPETLVCRGCASDDECPSVAPGTPEDDDRDGDGPIAPASASDFCVVRQCRECNPDDHQGCAEGGVRPICRAGDCDVCDRDADCDGRPGDRDECIPDGAAAGQCKLCDPADNAGCVDPANPVCDPGAFTCVPCVDDDECNRGRAPGAAPLECVGGQCSQCDPGDNAGCVVPSDVPFCDDDRRFCRGCLTADECVRLDTQRGLNANLVGCVAGECTQCDPQTQVGCPDTQVCAPDGRCRNCTVDGDDPLNPTGDDECALGDGLRDQCVDGQCEVCDPVNFAGCDPGSATPVCDGDTNTCQGCVRDRDCRAADGHPANPVGAECVDGFCRACDPTDGQENAGCVADSGLPYCDPALFECAPCGTGVEGEDTRCADNANPALVQCLGERCAVCDPNNHDGCVEASNQPFCDVGNATCRGCRNDAECFIRPGPLNQCVGNACVLCDPDDDAGCNDPNRPVCDTDGDGATFCRACERDNECPGAQLCVRNRCVECDPTTNRGCDVAAAAPYCDPGNFTCRACTLVPDDVGGGQDAECVDAARPQCVDGGCDQCDPETHDGCDEDGATPFCGANGVCRVCGGNAECLLRPGALDFCNADGQCVECNIDSNAGCPGESPVCDDGNETCRQCRSSDECEGAQECVGGTCVGCNPVGNINCDAGGTAPVCDAAERTCRGCANDGECDDNPSGDECFNGRCVECDPSGAQQVGCAVGGLEPFCASDGACRGCRTDGECEIAPGPRDQCVGVRCELCDPADNAGCDPASDSPICTGREGNRSCNGCSDDAQCADNPNGGQCVGGACVECDPSDDAGCDPDGAAPTCRAATNTCGGCQNDGDCADNGNGPQCVAGACEQCDPADSAGCNQNSAVPICNAATKRCEGCTNDAQCILRPGNRDVCVAPNCRLCDPDTDSGCEGTTPICNATGTACGPCEGNNDCGPGVQCLDAGPNAGACAGCNPQTNAGCDADNPICETTQGNETQCRRCENDAECGGLYCFNGRCEACDPEGHAGCGDNQLCCVSEGVFTCTETDPDSQCAACDTACDADGSNVCTNRTCRCGDLIECSGEQDYCLGSAPAGACSECRDNDDCVANSDNPICGADVAGNDTNTCRGCADDDECADHGRGPQCINETGACHVCDPGDDAGCLPNSNQPICGDDFTCRGCADDDECAENDANGGQCVANRCRECDRPDDGCVAGSERPVCIAGNVCGCEDDTDCAGNPNGGQCVGRVCAECDPAVVNNGGAGGGCDLGGDAPYCSPQSLTCVSCSANDNRCRNNPNGRLCDVDACVQCLTGTHAGCDDDQLCCDGGGGPACVATGLGNCTGCGVACGDGQANACDDRTCLCGALPECAEGLVCNGGACVECVDNVDCVGNPNGAICDGGTCRTCAPGSNDGCDPDSAQPICNPATFTCVPCNAQGIAPTACADDPDLDDHCFDGACEVCQPADHAGCAADQLCCNQATVQCVDTTDAQCTACRFGGCDGGQVCDDNRTCVDPGGG